MLVPDGRILLLMPLKNAMVCKMGGRIYGRKENRMSLVGISDMPSVVDAQDTGALGVLGVDFTPQGAYRFFRWKLKEIKNELNSLSDILGNEVRDVEERIADAVNIEGKVRILQQYLFDLFIQKSGDQVFEYCIQKIKESRGSIPVKELAQQTGYSSRWLNRKFDEMLGISPKNFSSIARFNFYYQALLTNAARILTHKEFYHHYYDESHFIREFKRFTGMPPVKLEHAVNNFGKLFL